MSCFTTFTAKKHIRHSRHSVLSMGRTSADARTQSGRVTWIKHAVLCSTSDVAVWVSRWKPSFVHGFFLSTVNELTSLANNFTSRPLKLSCPGIMLFKSQALKRCPRQGNSPLWTHLDLLSAAFKWLCLKFISTRFGYVYPLSFIASSFLRASTIVRASFSLSAFFDPVLFGLNQR